MVTVSFFKKITLDSMEDRFEGLTLEPGKPVRGCCRRRDEA